VKDLGEERAGVLELTFQGPAYFCTRTRRAIPLSLALGRCFKALYTMYRIVRCHLLKVVKKGVVEGMKP
jgi:hypothetical protein